VTIKLTTLNLFQAFLVGMFQFDQNDLDFGLFKVVRPKRQSIEQFIHGDGEQILGSIVDLALAAIQSVGNEVDRLWLAQLCEVPGLKPRNALTDKRQDSALRVNQRKAIRQAEKAGQVNATLKHLDR